LRHGADERIISDGSGVALTRGAPDGQGSPG